MTIAFYFTVPTHRACYKLDFHSATCRREETFDLKAIYSFPWKMKSMEISKHNTWKMKSMEVSKLKFESKSMPHSSQILSKRVVDLSTLISIYINKLGQ